MSSEKIIKGLGHNPNALTVQKSQPLLSLWKSNLTLGAFKVLDLYLSRIDSHHPENRTVVFQKGEIEQALGVSRITNTELKKLLKNTMQTVELPHVDMDGRQNKKKIDIISLFSRASADQSEDDLWNVTLKCTEEAMQYIFNLENLGYLRYKLNAVKNLRSRYSYIMFNYLEANRFRKSWDVPLEELKAILGCADTPTYSEYKRFSQEILKRIQKELSEKSNCFFSYEPLKHGRNKVYAVCITLESINPPLPELAQFSDFYPIADPDLLTEHTDPGAERRTFLADAVNNEFNTTQMDELLAVLASVPNSKLPYGETTELAQYNYLYQLYCRMNTRDTQQGKQPIKNRFRYLLRMIQADAKAS